MRGTHETCVNSHRPIGIIPAYAGNTAVKPVKDSANRDHPRVCGEHYSWLAIVRAKTGSSPRMRGTPPDRKRIPPAHGIIPAYAGNTVRAVRICSWCRDHPRVCGEHPYYRSAGVNSWGSSPRMRGTPSLPSDSSPSFGIIPAYAGNTIPTSSCVSPAWDHPRVCGEHSIHSSFFLTWSGSSPRMRGTPWRRTSLHIASRIIPAYAGNTVRDVVDFVPHGDHPRVCGEHFKGLHEDPESTGSSPRMRGTPVSSLAAICFAGIIPAYAGNTHCFDFVLLAHGDHPRVCGEHG